MWFSASDCFVKQKHASLLLNLFRLAYKTAVDLDASITESEGYAYAFFEVNLFFKDKDMISYYIILFELNLLN